MRVIVGMFVTSLKLWAERANASATCWKMQLLRLSSQRLHKIHNTDVPALKRLPMRRYSNVEPMPAAAAMSKADTKSQENEVP